MKDFTIAIYCFVDDLLLKIDNEQMSDSISHCDHAKLLSLGVHETVSTMLWPGDNLNCFGFTSTKELELTIPVTTIGVFTAVTVTVVS